MFTEVKQTSKPLPQLVSEEIEKLIVLGEFKPGDRLPSEYELAQRLGVGRSTVREATKALVSRNILEVHRGNGTFVCEQTGLVQDPLGLRFQPDKKRLGLDLGGVYAQRDHAKFGPHSEPGYSSFYRYHEACAADAVAVHSSGCCGCHSRARLRSCPAGDARASGRQSAKHRGAAG